MQRTDNEIIAVGAYTRTLASDETFNALFKEYTDAMLQRIVQSAPHEVKVREFEYAQIRAMSGFMDHLVGLAVAAADIINKNEAKNRDPEDMGVDTED